MKLQTFILLTVLLSFCSSAPILRQQLGIIASNSNEIVRLPGLTLTGMGLGQTQVQGSPFLTPFLIQSQPELLLPPQVLNLGPQFPGPFLPPQQNLPPFLFPSLQQEQPTGPINPNNPIPPPNGQDPVQVQVPQFFPFPQVPGGQGFPYYYMNYGFPQRNTMFNHLPNQNTANQNAANQNPVRPTKAPAQVLELLRMTPSPDNRGDRPGRGVDGDPAFPFFRP
ncbi:U1 small nuclear ribonucleoprotein C isoform X1 [Tachysurus ichikawai]